MLPRVFDRETGRDVPQTFTDLLDNFFDDAIKRGELTRFTPTVDISETDNEYELKVEVPGMEKDDFSVEIDNGNLKISGERKWEQEDKEKTYHRVESQYGSFVRSFTLPDEVKEDEIEANYDNGILRVKLPKDEKKTNTKKVDIK